MNRAARRAGLSDQRAALTAAKAEQAARRRSGDWPAWERHEVPAGTVGSGPWLGAIHTAFANGVYSVLVRTVETEWGPVEHASIHTLAGGDISWSAKHRIKNELFGADRVAIEVFPAAADLVDQADAYHVWVLPAGFRLPFTIARRADFPSVGSPVESRAAAGEAGDLPAQSGPSVHGGAA